MALHNDVFKQQIWEFFCDDLDSALIVSNLKQGGDTRFKGGLNFTSCLIIFTVIELCSGYLKGQDSDSNTVADFLVKFFSKYYDKFRDKEFSKYFYNVFRNGLAHQWSPKASAIDMNFVDNYFLMKVQGQNEVILYLNVPIFYEYTKKALEDFERELDNSESLKELFKKRYDQILSLDYQQMRILRAKF